MVRKGKNPVLAVLVLASSLGVTLFLSGVSYAAKVNYYGNLFDPSTGGGFSAYSKSEGFSSGVADSKTNDLTGVGGNMSISAGSTLVIPSFTDYTMVGGNTIGATGNYGFTDPLQTVLSVTGGGSYASTAADSTYSSNAFCRTDYGREGIYLQIEATAGENPGDLINVHFLWTAAAEMMTGWSGYLSGSNASGDIKLTLNDYTGGGSVLWSHPAVTVAPNSTFADSYNTVLSLHIGDILGVHLGAGAKADLSGYHYDPLTSSLKNQMEFTIPAAPAPIPGSLLLLGSGILGLLGLRRKF